MAQQIRRTRWSKIPQVAPGGSGLGATHERGHADPARPRTRRPQRRQLLPLVYDELRRLAAQKVSLQTPGQTLQPTDLVHEAYLRLVGEVDELHWDNRGHFFAAAAEAMRRILVDNARRKQAVKRGGGRRRLPLEEFHRITESPEDLLDLDEALTQFAAEEPDKARLV